MPTMRISPEAGWVSVDNFTRLTREQAGLALSPPVGEKTVKRYLEVLTIFSDNFKPFKDPETGRLNGEPITHYHIPELQKVRELFDLYNRRSRVQVELKKYYQHQQQYN